MRTVQALAIADALEQAWSGKDHSIPIPTTSGISPRERLTRSQATARVGFAGAIAGAFVGFAIFGSLMFASHQRPRAMGKPGGPPLLFFLFPISVVAGLLIGAASGGLIGRFVIFPLVRDCEPLDRRGGPGGPKIGRRWRSMVGMMGGFMLGGVLGMFTVFTIASRRPPNQPPNMSFMPLIFFGGAALGLFLGWTAGLILDFRHARVK